MQTDRPQTNRLRPPSDAECDGTFYGCNNMMPGDRCGECEPVATQTTDGDDGGEQQSMGLEAAIEIGLRDALQRADMWGDFAKEFMRLGLLARAMRGPSEVYDLAGRAAKACRDAMVAEKQIADRDLEFHNKFLEERKRQ